jgi:hypothetical protein
MIAEEHKVDVVSQGGFVKPLLGQPLPPCRCLLADQPPINRSASACMTRPRYSGIAQLDVEAEFDYVAVGIGDSYRVRRQPFRQQC